MKRSVIAVAAIVILLGSHYLYRELETYLQQQGAEALSLSVPLKQFPYHIGSWEGTEVPISETVLKVAANDDYLSRSYYNPDRQLQATIYVAYTSEPRRMLGHRPRECYVNSGWVHEKTDEKRLELEDGRAIPCLLHRFMKPGMEQQTIYVLNYYIINGQISSDYKDFGGIRWRRPRNARGHVDYVAQVQISSISEVAVLSAARDFSEILLTYFPKDLSLSGNREGL